MHSALGDGAGTLWPEWFGTCSPGEPFRSLYGCVSSCSADRVVSPEASSVVQWDTEAYQHNYRDSGRWCNDEMRTCRAFKLIALVLCRTAARYVFLTRQTDHLAGFAIVQIRQIQTPKLQTTAPRERSMGIYSHEYIRKCI